MSNAFNTLDELYAELDSIYTDHKLRKHSPILERYEGEDWIPLVEYDDKTYCRKKLESYSNDRFEFILISWNPNQSSPIHDHPESGCLLKILKGELVEEIYDRSDELNHLTTNKLQTSSVSYMESNRILHRIVNETNTPTISLHIYSPPNYNCKCY